MQQLHVSSSIPFLFSTLTHTTCSFPQPYGDVYNLPYFTLKLPILHSFGYKNMYTPLSASNKDVKHLINLAGLLPHHED